MTQKILNAEAIEALKPNLGIQITNVDGQNTITGTINTTSYQVGNWTEEEGTESDLVYLIKINGEIFEATGETITIEDEGGEEITYTEYQHVQNKGIVYTEGDIVIVGMQAYKKDGDNMEPIYNTKISAVVGDVTPMIPVAKIGNTYYLSIQEEPDYKDRSIRLGMYGGNDVAYKMINGKEEVLPLVGEEELEQDIQGEVNTYSLWSGYHEYVVDENLHVWTKTYPASTGDTIYSVINDTDNFTSEVTEDGELAESLNCTIEYSYDDGRTWITYEHIEEGEKPAAARQMTNLPFGTKIRVVSEDNVEIYVCGAK